MQDHYATLGVATHADPIVIQAAYKALMREYHPDRSKKSDATTRAKAINAAYAVLGDPQRRQAYDRARDAASSSPATARAAAPAESAVDSATPFAVRSLPYRIFVTTIGGIIATVAAISAVRDGVDELLDGK